MVLSRLENPSAKILANIEKHRQDILRLADILPDGIFTLPGTIRTTTKEALNKIAAMTNSETETEILAMLRQFYGLA
jgi:hypothetical protein